jgi:fatty acid desaturase
MMPLSPLVKNSLALLYTFLTYGLGIALLLLSSWEWNLVGVILVTHSLILSATFTHELIHGNIFKESRKLNAFWGQVMTHINGGCYATWDHLVSHHLNHHIHHGDFVGFDPKTHFQAMNPWLRGMYIVCEWAYLPLFEFELRWRVILAPFLEKDNHHLFRRNLGIMVYRTAAFALLGWYSPKTLILYAIAYISFVNLMHFVDAFHHTYEYVIMGQPIPKRDRTYEQKNTFSNFVSTRFPWLNLLFLNFGYHNAHHHNMSVPWHELPKLHQDVFGDASGGIMPLPDLAWNYHKFRLKRMFSGQGEASLESSSESTELAIDNFIGGVAVSFLTPPSLQSSSQLS